LIINCWTADGMYLAQLCAASPLCGGCLFCN